MKTRCHDHVASGHPQKRTLLQRFEQRILYATVQPLAISQGPIVGRISKFLPQIKWKYRQLFIPPWQERGVKVRSWNEHRGVLVEYGS